MDNKRNRGGAGAGIFGVGMTVAAFAVAACANPSSASSASPGQAPAPNTTTTAASQPPTSDAASDAGPRKLSADELKAGLLPQSGFGMGFVSQNGYPKTDAETNGYVSFIGDAKCADGVVNDDMGSVAGAADLARDGGTGTPNVVSQRVYQFNHGDAAQMVAAVKARTNGKCAKYDDEPAYGKPGDTVVEKATDRAGLGDQAVAIEQTITGPDLGTRHVEILDVRHGDVVVSVSYSSADASKARAYDLAGKAEAIAANLGVG